MKVILILNLGDMAKPDGKGMHFHLEEWTSDGQKTPLNRCILAQLVILVRR